MRQITIVLVLIISFLLISNSSDAQQKKLRIVTTLHYLADLSRTIGGEYVQATPLSNPRQDPHYVTPTPRMNQLANSADLFIENGLSLDSWAKNVLDASGNPRIQPGTRGHIVATINVPVRELPTEASRALGDIHPQGNPHAWLDPFNAKIIAENIAKRLQQLDPTNATIYAERLQDFVTSIDEAMFGEQLLRTLGTKAGDILTRKAVYGDLESWLKSKGIENQLGGWMKKTQPIRGLKVVSYHKTYIYFSNRFGVTIADELEEKPGIPPPPKHRDAIVDFVRREGIKVILNDNFYSSEAAEYVASRTNAKVLTTYIDVDATEGVDSYGKLINRLIDDLVHALQ